MKVIQETFERGKSRREILQTGKKKFVRIASERGVEWRRAKTNHQVKRVEFENLEKEYQNRFPLHFAPSAFMKPRNIVAGVPVVENDKKRVTLEKGLVEASDDGKMKLAGIRYIKEATGWGLKESKEFVDNFFDRKVKYINATKSTVKEEAKRRLVEFMKNNDSKLACVKYLVGITGWGLRDSKDFFEDYMKFKEAQKLVRRGF